LVFIDDESMQEVASFKMTMRKLYIGLSTLMVAIILLTLCVLLLTPLRYYIPGYGSNKTRMQVVKLKRNVDSLSDLVAAQQVYENNIKKVIDGDYKGQRDTTLLSKDKIKDDETGTLYPMPVTKIPADSATVHKNNTHKRTRKHTHSSNE